MRSDEGSNIESQREKIIGLGKLSIRKSYYPQLQQQQEALKQSEAQLRSILHAAPMMQFVIDHNHRVISWNKAMETYSGISADEILGTDEQWRAFYREKRPVLADILFDQTFHLLTVWYREKFSRSRFVADGYEVTEFFPNFGNLGKWLHATAVPIKDAQGTVIGVIETLEDITERRSAEEALKESEKFLNSVVENIPDMIFVKEVRDLRFVKFNKAGEDLIGYKRDELLGKTDYDFFSKAEADYFTQTDRNTIIKGEIVDIPEEKILTRMKGERILHTKKILISDEMGNPAFLMGISEDITENRRMEVALQMARKKMNLLNTITFQDIETATFTITGYHELLKSLVTDEKTKKFLEEEISAIQRIIDSLNFARNYQEMGINPPRWQNIHQIFLLAISHLDFLKIKRNFDVAGLEVYADSLLEKVIFHMMQNTLRYGIYANEVNVRYMNETDELVLFIEDNGVGIPDEEKNIIFDRGYGKNKGLGLFLVREVLSITGMSIRETGEPGKGVRFEITVPKGMYRFNEALK